MQPLKFMRHPTVWGAAALAVLTIIALVAAWIYVVQPGRKTVTFYTDDAASVQPGDSVRIAGINVGEVKDLQLESDRIRVTARVDGSAFVGDKSQVQVRMLTVVGGYYVNVVSLGDRPLGSTPIPLERVSMPYSLVRTLADATKITDTVDAKPINETLNQLQAGLSGTNAESLTAIIDAGNALMSTIDRQRGQLTSILNLSDEYLESLAGFRATMQQMVRKVAILEQTLVLYGKEMTVATEGISKVLQSLKTIGTFYAQHRNDVLEKIRDWQHKARLWIDRNGLIVRILKRVQGRFQRILDAQNAPPEFLATDLCVPVPGSSC